MEVLRSNWKSEMGFLMKFIKWRILHLRRVTSMLTRVNMFSVAVFGFWFPLIWHVCVSLLRHYSAWLSLYEACFRFVGSFRAPSAQHYSLTILDTKELMGGWGLQVTKTHAHIEESSPGYWIRSRWSPLDQYLVSDLVTISKTTSQATLSVAVNEIHDIIY